MKFQPAQNSLFAILLRSRWWISFVVAGAFVSAPALLPPEWFVVGAVGALPFTVIRCIAAWRQWRAPDPEARVAEALQALRAMPLERILRRDRGVFAATATRWRRPATRGRLRVNRGGRVSLVACKRWKVTWVGIEPLRELRAAQQRRKADECIRDRRRADRDCAFVRRRQRRAPAAGAELAALLPVQRTRARRAR
ncbi:MAG: restriction endonuclease [Burkholderiaceae bacterium]|nr:restriction endonuclease [Burkholderiaceae bacterium]